MGFSGAFVSLHLYSDMSQCGNIEAWGGGKEIFSSSFFFRGWSPHPGGLSFLRVMLSGVLYGHTRVYAA